MKLSIPLLCLLLGLFSNMAGSEGSKYPYRWFYMDSSLRKDREVMEIREIVRIASEHGLNGMVFSSPGLEYMDKKPPEYLQRLKEVAKICKQHEIEIIPLVFSVGYGDPVLKRNKHLAAGLPVKNAQFYVWNEEARLISDLSVAVVNGGFEKFNGSRFIGYQLQDRPGQLTFADTKIFKKGRVSLRIENTGNNSYRKGRIMQKVHVKPYRNYRVTCWVRTEDLKPSGCFWPQVHGSDKRILMEWGPDISGTGDWEEVVFGFNSCDNNVVNIYLGLWGWDSGKIWIDDLEIEEVALINVLSRPGTPVTVRNKKTDEVYREGRDYVFPEDDKMDFKYDHDGVPIKIVPGSKIENEERLLVDYYHGSALHRSQVSLCMSEPELYKIWEEQAKQIHEAIAPNFYFLSMDEIRAGGFCNACKQRGMTMAQILGSCISRQVNILHSVNPKAEICIWSDMLDPNHNAHDKYYLVDGDLTDSWKYIPEDLIIVCWYYKKRQASMNHFSASGFNTVAGAYYDKGMDNPRGWLKVMNEITDAKGIMYTTWKGDYSQLASFGDLVFGNDNKTNNTVPLK